MSTTIPYNPSLELANIVPQKMLENLLEIAKLEAPINAAEESLNSAILTLRSLDMTLTEMINMGIDTSGLQTNRETAQKNIKEAAERVVKARLDGIPKINELKSKLTEISESIESPVNYTRTQIKKMPLSADSLKMDAQYFSLDEEQQDANNSLSAIKSFVSSATQFLGTKRSMEVTSAVQEQVTKQREHHTVEGTLVITANCTHKNAALLAPFILDVDKAISVWNTVFPDQMIKTNSLASIQKIAQLQQTKDAKALNILSGATYGSCFIGMVHVIRTEDTKANQTMLSLASSLQGQMEIGGWFSNLNGGFGVDAQFADDVKSLLSNQQISSHISLITMGAIPSVKSNEVAIGVKEFADFDPAKMMEKLATIANLTSGDQKSVQDSAAAARIGNEMIQIRGSEIKNVMSGLGKIDDGKNKLLDINSLMTSFEDYVQKALAGDCGVPITFYLKPITAAQLAQMWIAKYFPGEYVTAAGDDSDHTEPPSK